MKKAGILLHISSLPGSFGIGTFGKKAYEFVDFLKRAGQSCWQILPLSPTSFGDSPYQSPSIYAGNPYFIDPLLVDNDFNPNLFSINDGFVDYKKQFIVKNSYIRSIKPKLNNDYFVFCKKNKKWLDDYALFNVLKQYHKNKPWQDWAPEYRYRNKNALDLFSINKFEDINRVKYIQYLFYTQWSELKKYANNSGIKIIGDLPIYVAYDSAEVWSHPELFQLDDNLTPIKVAGVPPDYFSDLGQLWGNPLYNWAYMKYDNYQWWIERINFALDIYDLIRMDHFRGFSQYYSIPYGENNAIVGNWEMGPGIDLFKLVKGKFNDDKIIVEDLGIHDDLLQSLLDYTNYPGMKVLQFELININPQKQLDKIKENKIIYTGTHDNETIMGWYNNLPIVIKKLFKNKLSIDEENINWSFIKLAYQTNAKLVLIPIQDILGLDNNFRMNTPSTITGNWRYRVGDNDLTNELSNKLLFFTSKYDRL